MSNKNNIDLVSRRHFLSKLGYGGAGLLVMGSYGFTISHDENYGKIRALVVDFSKCTGCRTCEAVCSEYNNKVVIGGKELNSTANLSKSNIRVHHFNPDIDVPSACVQCQDAPCIAACPVDPHPDTGHRALYRDPVLNTIINDKERCIGCRSCYTACKEQRAGVIRSNPDTGSPEGICSLCNGDPQCVKNCPYDALSYIESDITDEFRGKSPEYIAKKLIKKLYNINIEEV